MKKTIEELEAKIKSFDAYVMRDAKIKELRDDLEWATALLRERADVTGRYGSERVQEIRTRHNLDKKGGE